MLRKLKAWALNTFVADCPRCHKHFYGHQQHSHQVKDGHKHYRYVCGKCVADIKRVTKGQ